MPALAVTPFLATAGLGLACVLILAERTGKAVRSPAKSALLAHSAGAVGWDAASRFTRRSIRPARWPVRCWSRGWPPWPARWPSLAVLVVPGVASLLTLIWIRHRSDNPDAPKPQRGVGSDGGIVTASARRRSARPPDRLPGVFWQFALAAGAATAGLMTFGVIAYHLTQDRVVPVAAIPLVYAVAMASGGVAALGTGWLYDHMKGRVLLPLPFLVAAVPPLAFTDSVPAVLIGVSIWGLAVGVQDSTVKALVADLVPPPRRATAYGIFAAVQGTAAILGGTMAGALYERSLPALFAVVGATQLMALLLLIVTLRHPLQGERPAVTC